MMCVKRRKNGVYEKEKEWCVSKGEKMLCVKRRRDAVCENEKECCV
jgi:hypothetical protein